VVSSLPSTEETGAMGREFESHQGVWGQLLRDTFFQKTKVLLFSVRIIEHNHIIIGIRDPTYLI
jgi:hypothetical protein